MCKSLLGHHTKCTLCTLHVMKYYLAKARYYLPKARYYLAKAIYYLAKARYYLAKAIYYLAKAIYYLFAKAIYDLAKHLIPPTQQYIWKCVAYGKPPNHRFTIDITCTTYLVCTSLLDHRTTYTLCTLHLMKYYLTKARYYLTKAGYYLAKAKCYYLVKAR